MRRCVAADLARAATLTVTELAAACDTSETTVIRFCKAVGFAGYPQFRLALATDAGRAEGNGREGRVIGSDIGPGDDLA